MDISAIYYTSNHISDYFSDNVCTKLLEAIGDIPLISVSQKPLKFGKNICVGDIGRCNYNIYKQLLIGAKEAKTEYIACCEDDILYTPEHFMYRPTSKNVFAYNHNRWELHTWEDDPIFSYKNRSVLNQMIAPRELLIEALEERFAKFPTSESINVKHFGELGKYEDYMGVTVREKESFMSVRPNIIFIHKEALGYEVLGSKKKHGDKRVKELPYWGTAKEVKKLYEI